MMNNRLKAWIGFNDGKCDEDTQVLIDDIKELEKKLAEAVEHIYWISSQDEKPFAHYDLIVNESKKILKSLEEKEGER